MLDTVKNESCRLVITSPPYNIGKEYERGHRRSLKEYVEWLDPIVEKICRKVAADGSLCWQVGNHIRDGEVFPLDYFLYELITKRGEPTAVVLSIEQYRQLTHHRPSFKDFLTAGPSWEGLEIERVNTGVRNLDL